MAGRRPQSSRLKALAGNPGRRPLNTAAAPTGRKVYCPSWLSDEAKAEWRRVAPELHRRGLLTLLDRTALALYCQAYAQWREAEQVLAERGMTYVTNTGNMRQRPEVAIAASAHRAAKAMALEFGMTPGSRGKVDGGEPPEPDPFAEFLQSGELTGLEPPE